MRSLLTVIFTVFAFGTADAVTLDWRSCGAKTAEVTAEYREWLEIYMTTEDAAELAASFQKGDASQGDRPCPSAGEIAAEAMWRAAERARNLVTSRDLPAPQM